MDNSQNFNIKAKFFIKTSLFLGVTGLLLSVFGYLVNDKHFFHSYLVAYVFWTSIMLGALFFTMLNHIAGATWNIVFRRILESLMGTVPLMAILFIPVIFGLHDLYHWSHEEVITSDILPLFYYKSDFVFRNLVCIIQDSPKNIPCSGRGISTGPIKKDAHGECPGYCPVCYYNYFCSV